MRGFILKLDYDNNTIQKALEENKRLWPKVEPDSQKLASLYSINPNIGKTAIFNKSRDIIDIGANLNKCYNIFPFSFVCGNKTNVNANDQKQEIIERSVTKVIYYV